MRVAYACTALFLALLTTGGPSAGAQTPSPPKQASAGAPVRFADKELFRLYAEFGPLTPDVRAQAVMERLDRLAVRPFFDPDSITVVAGELHTDIAADDVILVTVTDGDARALGLSRPEAARQYAARIRGALQARLGTPEDLLLGLLFTAIATMLLVLIWKFGVRRGFRKLLAEIESWSGTRIHALRIQRLEVLPAERITAILIGAAKALRLLVLLVLIYVYLSLEFSFFPQTRGFAGTLFDYTWAAIRTGGAAIFSSLPNLIVLVVIIAATRYVIKGIRLFFVAVERGALHFVGFYPEWATPTYQIVRFATIAFAATVAFPYIPGSDTPAFRGISVFLGVLFSLGSTSAVANVVAGMILTYMRPFRPGDRVKIADTFGDVVEKTLLVTRVRTTKNVVVTIPNSMVLGSHLVNYSASARNPGLILHTSVTIGYDAPWRTVHELLIAAARSTPQVLPDPAPYVLQTALNDFYVTYELNAFTGEPTLSHLTLAKLHEAIQDKFNEAGVEIMSPHYAQLRDGNRTTIPEPYLPESYEPPALRVARVDEAARAPRPADLSATEGRGES